MGKLIYSAITSLDGYINDQTGGFEWAAPDEQVHAFVNELERGVGTYLYGRRMYETMLVWETWDVTGEPAPVVDYANIWRAADKVVYSASLDSVSTERTRLEPSFDPEKVRALKSASAADLSIGGANLGGQALRAGLVDELHLLLNPVVVGGGTAALPVGLKQSLELLDERRFAFGVVHLHYRVTNHADPRLA